jgi:hypothetical protein
MTEDEAVELVYEGLAGMESIPVKLRMGEGLDTRQLASVQGALRLLIERWKGRPTVPKRLAAAFVDLQGAMEVNRDSYPEAVQESIEDAAVDLLALAWELFEEEPER